MAKKHKLAKFYLTLGNIKPEYRSKQNFIQLYASALSIYIQKYGFLKIIDFFISDIKILKQDEVTIETGNGDEITFEDHCYLSPKILQLQLQ